MFNPFKSANSLTWLIEYFNNNLNIFGDSLLHEKTIFKKI